MSEVSFEDSKPERQNLMGGSIHSYAWVCNICRTASFRTYLEALDHERKCDTPPNPPSENDATHVAHPGYKADSHHPKKNEPFNVVLERVLRRAPLFTGLGWRVMGLQQTDARPWNSSHANKISKKRKLDSIVFREGFSSKAKNYAWVCDICCTATFSTYTAAEEHKRNCDKHQQPQYLQDVARNRAIRRKPHFTGFH